MPGRDPDEPSAAQAQPYDYDVRARPGALRLVVGYAAILGTLP